VKIVLTAGLLETFDEPEATAAGADAIIKKPFEASVVLQTIKPLADGAQAASRQRRQQNAVELRTPAEEPLPVPSAAASQSRSHQLHHSPRLSRSRRPKLLRPAGINRSGADSRRRCHGPRLGVSRFSSTRSQNKS
jgi:hypothetical protein